MLILTFYKTLLMIYTYPMEKKLREAGLVLCACKMLFPSLCSDSANPWLVEKQT